MKGAAMILALALGACSTAETYEANYDALARARAKCVEQGGELQLAIEGDPQRLDAWRCVRK
jgi:hypothetical protein